MKVPLSWLADHIAGELPPSAEIAARLSLVGAKAEHVTRRGLPLADGNDDRVLAGLVVEAGKHPNADRLQLTRVDVGEPEPRQIVCGAWNFAAGDTVAVVLPGAILPGGHAITSSTLRGETSDGMILSERELELSDAHEGILVLGDGYAPGERLVDRLALRDEVIELEISSNRPDLLGVRGVARDLAAACGLRLAQLDDDEPEADGDGTLEDWIRVESAAPALCPRFTARVFCDVRVEPAPLWMRARLTAAGYRPISNVVDVTNYVMHDLGQPIHAYDHARVPGRVLTARPARAGEAVVTLDGRERAIPEGMLVIADGEGLSGVAGIMGGASSEISDTTTAVVIEAAHFERVHVLRSSRALGLRTDASARFEKGVDPELPPVASRAVARHLVSWGARMVPGAIDLLAAELPPRAELHLRAARVDSVAGFAVPATEATATLTTLGFEPAPGEDGWAVRVPTWRGVDVTREIDVAEEIIRIAGLDRVPSRLPHGPGAGLNAIQRLRRALADACRGAGLSEVQTIALVPADWADRVGLPESDPRRPSVVVSNPMSAELAVLRPMLLPSLLAAARHNVAQGRADLALFEIAHVYRPGAPDGLAFEPWTLAGLVVGRLGGTGWRASGPQASFFLARGLLDAALAAVGLEAVAHAGDGHDAFLHPGRAARVLVGGEDVGYVGELHPLAAERHELPAAACFELDVDALMRVLGPLPVETAVPTSPPLRQDISLVIGDEHAAADAIAVAQAAGGELLAGVTVFDVYRDEAALGAGRRSLGLRLRFQAADRTLNDEEIAPLRQSVVRALEERFGAVLRG